MLRVEFDQDGNGQLTMRLQGRLVGVYAEDARVTLARFQVPKSILVDLSEVTFVDPFGEQVLLWLGRLGAKFVAANVYASCICERLQLQLSEQGSDSARGEMSMRSGLTENSAAHKGKIPDELAEDS